MQFFRAVTGSLVLIIAGLALFGWLSDTPNLASSGIDSLPIPPLTSVCLFLLALCHLTNTRFPFIARALGLATCGLITAEALSRLQMLPQSMQEGFANIFAVAPTAQHISLNGLLCILALAFGHLTANFFKQSARGQTVVLALSLVAICIAIVALYGYVTNLPSAFQWGDSIPLSPNVAGLLLLLGLSKAGTAWSHLLALLDNFVSIARELRLVVLALFLALASLSSAIAVRTVRDTQQDASQDLVNLYAESARERLDTYFGQLIVLADGIRRQDASVQRNHQVSEETTTRTKDFIIDFKRLGVLGASYTVVASQFGILRSEVDAHQSPQRLVQLRIFDHSLFFIRSVTSNDIALQLEIDLDHVRRVATGGDTDISRHFEVLLTPVESERALYYASGSTSFSVRAAKGSDLQNEAKVVGALAQIASHNHLSAIQKVSLPELEVLVTRKRMDSSFATHSGMLGLIATLLILALIGSTTLMHLISSLGRRSTRLGEQLSSTIERLQIEISERERDARIIQEAAREKEVLLREVHHRVKNNLQIISSIFNLQLRRTHDEGVRDLLKAACSRLQAISLLHQTLYRSKRLSDIAVVGYIREVVEHALNNFGVDQRIKIDVTSDEKALEVEKAIAIGLIITELIINSVKHAWPKDKNDTGTLPYGHIRLDIRRIDEYRARLDYGDDGVGLPPDFDIGTHHSLGMKLITILTKQLRGTLEVRQGVAKGSSFTVTFPIKYEEDEYGACANSDSRR